jgi:hypothetical protein
LFYRLFLAGQGLFYLVALAGFLLPAVRFRSLKIPQAFLTLNGAALVAMYLFLRGKTAVWKA